MSIPVIALSEGEITINPDIPWFDVTAVSNDDLGLIFDFAYLPHKYNCFSELYSRSQIGHLPIRLSPNDEFKRLALYLRPKGQVLPVSQLYSLSRDTLSLIRCTGSTLTPFQRYFLMRLLDDLVEMHMFGPYSCIALMAKLDVPPFPLSPDWTVRTGSLLSRDNLAIIESCLFDLGLPLLVWSYNTHHHDSFVELYQSCKSFFPPLDSATDQIADRRLADADEAARGLFIEFLGRNVPAATVFPEFSYPPSMAALYGVIPFAQPEYNISAEVGFGKSPKKPRVDGTNPRVQSQNAQIQRFEDDPRGKRRPKRQQDFANNRFSPDTTQPLPPPDFSPPQDQSFNQPPPHPFHHFPGGPSYNMPPGPPFQGPMPPPPPFFSHPPMFPPQQYQQQPQSPYPQQQQYPPPQQQQYPNPYQHPQNPQQQQFSTQYQQPSPPQSPYQPPSPQQTPYQQPFYQQQPYPPQSFAQQPYQQHPYNAQQLQFQQPYMNQQPSPMNQPGGQQRNQRKQKQTNRQPQNRHQGPRFVQPSEGQDIQHDIQSNSPQITRRTSSYNRAQYLQQQPDVQRRTTGNLNLVTQRQQQEQQEQQRDDTQ